MTGKRVPDGSSSAMQYARELLQAHPDPPRPVDLARLRRPDTRSAVAVGLYVIGGAAAAIGVAAMMAGGLLVGLVLVIGGVGVGSLALLPSWLFRRNLERGFVVEARVIEDARPTRGAGDVVPVRVAVEHPALGSFEHEIDGIAPKRAERFHAGDTLKVLVPARRKGVVPPYDLQ